tara:strand:+ start:736 stop:993 length:258 start_codon:yes stop_codon:yes gene_type:complete
MKIFVELETNKLSDTPEGIEDIEKAIDEARGIIGYELKDGGIYPEGVKDKIVGIGWSKGRGSGFAFGRVLFTANLNTGIYEFRQK